MVVRLHGGPFMNFMKYVTLTFALRSVEAIAILRNERAMIIPVVAVINQ